MAGRRDAPIRSTVASRHEASFEILCVCGDVAQGMRLDREQEPLCPRCGEPLFVLPLDVYPRQSVAERTVAPALGRGRAVRTRQKVPALCRRFWRTLRNTATGWLSRWTRPRS